MKKMFLNFSILCLLFPYFPSNATAAGYSIGLPNMEFLHSYRKFEIHTEPGKFYYVLIPNVPAPVTIISANQNIIGGNGIAGLANIESFYKNGSYFKNVSLLLGIPSGEWNHNSGPLVFDPFDGDEFVEKKGSRGTYYSGEVRLNDLLPDEFKSDIDNPFLMATYAIKKTWPKNIYGFRYWPGASNMKQPYSDNDLFFVLENRKTKYLRNLPIQLNCSVYHFSDSYASKILFFDIHGINQTDFNFQDVYVGLYEEANIPTTLLNGYQYGFEKLARIKYDLSPIGDYPANLSYFYTKGWENKYLPYSDPNFGFPYFSGVGGVQILDAPIRHSNQDILLTSWHFINARDFYGLSEKDSILYALMSGDTTWVPDSLKRVFFKADSLGHLNPRYDSEDASNRFRDPYYPWLYSLLASGPFSWASQDTFHFVFAVIYGDNRQDLMRSAGIAHRMYNLGYRRSGPPVPPQVTAVPGMGKVTLYWNNIPETTPDPITGYRNFEGYKIYRTTINPAKNEWGQPWYDSMGRFLGFLPIAQFDKKDGIAGLDSLYPHLYLGDDSGIRHVWTDTTVENGVTYYYSVTAYDYGIRHNSLLNPDGYPPLAAKECEKGTDPAAAPNLVAVTPGGPSDNAVYPRVTVSPLPETKGNTEVVVRTVNPFAITGHDYRLVLGKDRAGWYFNIFDETTGVLKLENVHAVKGGESPVVDGLLPWVFRFDTLGVLTDSTKWVKADGSPSKCNWRVFGWANYKKASYDYEIRFTGKQDTSVFFGKTAPFEIWNQTLNRKAAWEIFINSAKDTTAAMRQRWTDGDYITLQEKLDGRLHFTWYFVLESHPSAVPVRVDTVIGGKDTTIVDTTWLDIPPETGDVLEIRTMKPGWVGDSYRIVTRAMKARPVSETDLSGIRVVPNPYMVTAEWETGPEDHRVLFTHLPSVCTIKIYTVTGELVRKLDHKDLDSGQEFWDLRNQSNMDVSYGLYLYVVTTPNGREKGGKFAIVR